VADRELITVVQTTVWRVRVDLSHPDWSWLKPHPREEWAALLTESANETEGALDSHLDGDALDGCWRDAVVGEARIPRPYPEGEPDPAVTAAVESIATLVEPVFRR
jgi:hypothetical protein